MIIDNKQQSHEGEQFKLIQNQGDKWSTRIQWIESLIPRNLRVDASEYPAHDMNGNDSSNQDRPHHVKPSGQTPGDTVHHVLNIHQKQWSDATTVTSSFQPMSNSDTDPSDTHHRFSDVRIFYELKSQDENPETPLDEMEIHLKHSEEKNGANPNELPEIWMVPPAPLTPSSPSSSIGEEYDDDVEMVSRAPEPDDDTDEGNEMVIPCRSIQGKYGERATKNPGVVLRYQYELVQNLDGVDWTINSEGERDGSEYLMENVIPNLEQAIGDVLVDEFFEECQVGKRRGRGLRHDGPTRRLQSIVGIDGLPTDIPLEQEECISEFVPDDPLQNFQCHVMQGALTLYFPPNYSPSTLLSGVTLSTLNAIKQGMTTDLLKSSQNQIMSLLFLDKSYSLEPEYSADKDLVEAELINAKSDRDSHSGLIVGIIVPLLLILACAGVLCCFKLRKDEQEATNPEYQSGGEHQVSAKRLDNEVESLVDDLDERADDGTTTSDDDDNRSSTSEDRSTTSGSKEATTDSDQEDTSSYSSDSDAVYEEDDDDEFGAYRDIFKKNKKGSKKVKNNIVMEGACEDASVVTGATGATGLHSVSSLRTVKMKNIVLPNILDVDINMM